MNIIINWYAVNLRNFAIIIVTIINVNFGLQSLETYDYSIKQSRKVSWRNILPKDTYFNIMILSLYNITAMLGILKDGCNDICSLQQTSVYIS